MASRTVTPSHPFLMSRHTHLLRRGSRYYFNAKVPLDLQTHFQKKIIRKSLATSDSREANRLVRFESLKWQTQIDDTRTKLRGRDKVSDCCKRSLLTVSDNEAHALILRWFIDLEKSSDDWWSREGISLADVALDETLDSLQIDQAALLEGNNNYLPDDGSHDLDVFLVSERIDCSKDSPAYQKLRPLFRRARLENTQRTIDRLTTQKVETS